MRLFQAVFFGSLIVGFGILLISCGSNDANYRIVNTLAVIANEYNIDIDVNVATPTTTTATFTNVPFPAVEPASGYQKIATGSDPIEVFQTGTTTPVITATSLNLGPNYYTVLLLWTGGSLNAPAAQVLSDNNNTPSAGNGEFRVVNASPSAPGGSVDIYLLPSGTVFPNAGISPDVSGLGYGQPSNYISKTGASGGTGGNYQLWVTPHGNQTPYIRGFSYSLSVGQILTIVLVDVAGGGFISSTPVLLTDLQ